MNSKTLELIFRTEAGRTVRITLRDPIEPVEPAAVNNVMDTILAKNLFQTNGANWTEKVGARLQDRTVTELPLA
ncbi:MAG: hypothetical protein BAA01_10480 [Bacillus thermozeamaize]|jgi:hypothetical protein|uniref:DUF2922 domain-containing protein n=1 Tax=Bacillus thermozeamaize TaxID=230954 RepID=A0A1Y3PDU5_9BACI|nr:MAG: hypothetical protein BAA01_10480 [Bacillus thermozeamaize]